MLKRILLLCAILASSFTATAQTAALPVYACTLPGTQALTSGMKSTNYQMGVIRSCTVTVYLTGTTTLATSSPQSPFTANTNGSIPPIYAAVNQGYDVVLSGGIAPNTYAAPVTLTGLYPGSSFSGGFPAGCSFATSLGIPCGGTGSSTAAGAWTNIFNGAGIAVSCQILTTDGTGVLVCGHVADVSHNGYLSSTDWGTFNGKQAALTNPVTGPGSGATVGHMALMGNTSGTSITDGGAVPTLSSLGGAGTGTCTVGQYENADATGGPSCAQVAASQVSGMSAYAALTGAAFTGPVSAPQIGPVYVADSYPGADCGAKINAAITASGGIGTILVGAGCGYSITTTVNPSGAPAAIQFVSAGKWTQSAPIINGANGGSVSGISYVQIDDPPVVLMAAPGYSGLCPADIAGTTYYSQICMETGSSLHDIGVDGNKAAQSSAVNDVLVQNANTVYIHDVTLANSAQDLIHITNTFYPTVSSGETLALNSVVYLYATDAVSYLYKVTAGGTGTSFYPSCLPTLNSSCTWGGATLKNIGTTYDGYSSNGWVGPNVLFSFSGRHGMFAERVHDWTVAGNVQFELAGSDGFHCEDCAAFRFTQDDFGANGRYGIKSLVVHGQCNTAYSTEGTMITGSTQFGGNVSGDIYVNGSAETKQPVSGGIDFCASNPDTQFAGAYTITGNQFISPPVTGLTSIEFVDAGANVVADNTWGAVLYSAQYLNLVKTSFSTIASYARQPSVVASNSWMLNNSALPPYSAVTPYSLTAGIDVGDYLSANGTVTEYGNRIIASLILNTGTAMTGNQGNGANVFHATGAFTSGNLVKTDVSGNAVDGGAIPSVGTWGALNYPTWVSGSPFVKMTAAGTFALDTSTYLTSSGVSGMTAGQIPIAASATTVTSSIGYGTSANLLLQLDSGGKVPAANLPAATPTALGGTYAPTVAQAGGDLACAVAADTTIGAQTATAGSSTTSAMTYTMAAVPSYIRAGSIVQGNGNTPSGYNGGPFTATSVNSTQVTVSSANNPGTMTGGGTLSLYCLNQAVDGAVTPVTFTNNYAVGAGQITAGSVLSVAAEFTFLDPYQTTFPGISFYLYKGSTVLYQMGAGIGIANSANGRYGMQSYLLTGVSTTLVNADVSATQLPMNSYMGYFQNSLQLPLAISAAAETLTERVGFAATGVASITSSSGCTVVGSIGQTVLLTSFNNTSTATATGTLTSANTIAGATWVITARGASATAAPTSATCSAGSVTSASGTATLTTTLGGSPGNAVLLRALVVRPY